MFILQHKEKDKRYLAKLDIFTTIRFSNKQIILHTETMYNKKINIVILPKAKPNGKTETNNPPVSD